MPMMFPVDPAAAVLSKMATEPAPEAVTVKPMRKCPAPATATLAVESPAE